MLSWLGTSRFNSWISVTTVFSWYTVESLSLFYPLFISRFVCTRRWYIDWLEIFNVNHLSWFTSEIRVRLVPSTMFKPSSIRYWPFQGVAFYVDSFVICVCSLQPCCHLLGKDWPLGSLVCGVFLYSCHVPIWRPKSVLVFNCIDSESLSYSLLSHRIPQ